MPVRGRPLKQILLAAFFLASMATARGQIIIYPNLGVYGVGYNRLDAINTLWLPTGCGAPVGSASLNAPGQKPRRSALYADTCEKHIYWYVPGDSTWQRIDTGGGGGSGTVTAVILSHDSLYYVTGSGNTFVSLIVTQADSTVLYVTPTQLTAALGTKLSAISTQFSVTGLGTPGSPVQLVGDVNAPGNSYYYGTNGSGAKGFYVIPAGVTSANPSQTISGSVVNGSATTFMRSDGAPAIASNAVTNTLLAQAPTNTIKGNNTGGTANEADLTISQVNTMLATVILADSTIFYVTPTQLTGAIAGLPTIFNDRTDPNSDSLAYTSGSAVGMRGYVDTSTDGTVTITTSLSNNHTIIHNFHSAGGGGAVSSVADNGTGTTVISPTTGSVLVGINASAFPVSFVPAVNNSVNIGSSSKNWENLYVNNIISPGALAFEVPTGSAYQFNINGTTNMGLLTTGQLQLQNYTTTSSFTGTAVGVLEFTSSGAIITAGLPSGAVSSVSDNGGGTLTISPTTGAVLAGINLANSNTWTATNNSFKNILPSATTTYSLGSTGVYWNNVYTNNLDVNNILPPSNLVIQLATGQLMETYINGVIKEELLSTGQKQLNGYGSGTFTGTPTFALNVDATGHLIEGTVGGGGIGVDSVQSVTSGTTVTQTTGYNIIQVNPSSPITLTITTATTFHTSNDLYIVFGGTITSGNPVCTLTMTAGAGLTFVQSVNPSGTTYNAGEMIRFHKIGSLLYRYN